METDKQTIFRLAKELLGINASLVRSIGIGPIATQLAALKGMEQVTRCDADSGDTGQYYGDLVTDLRRE